MDQALCDHWLGEQLDTEGGFESLRVSMLATQAAAITDYYKRMKYKWAEAFGQQTNKAIYEHTYTLFDFCPHCGAPLAGYWTS